MKVCDHLENAHWFYLDFLRPDDPSLPAGNFEEFLATSKGITINIVIKVVPNKDFGRQRKWILTHQHCTKCVPHAKSRFSTMFTSYRRAH